MQPPVVPRPTILQGHVWIELELKRRGGGVGAGVKQQLGNAQNVPGGSMVVMDVWAEYLVPSQGITIGLPPGTALATMVSRPGTVTVAGSVTRSPRPVAHGRATTVHRPAPPPASSRSTARSATSPIWMAARRNSATPS